MAEPATVVATEWGWALDRVCAGDGLRAVYQPMVDLQRGLVVGYEALVRVDGPGGRRPSPWRAVARHHGREAELEAAKLTVALAARADLPPDTFLSVNVSPQALASDAVRAVLDDEGDLRGLVLELTERSSADGYAELRACLDVHRSRGALVAIDDVGTGYAGLTRILELRPSLLKLDPAIVSGVDRDEAKRILVEVLGAHVAHLDTWLLATGIESPGELATLRRMGVPLGQGRLLGHPGVPWAGMDARAVDALVHEARAVPGGRSVGSLLDAADTDTVPARALATVTGRPADAVVVVVDEHRRPVGLATPAAARRGATSPVLVVAAATPVSDVAHRALTRPSDRRFEPVVCVDTAGRLLGVVRLDRVMARLARAVGAGAG